MQRYFANVKDNQVLLSEEDNHHLLHVMRARVNDEIIVIDNSISYLCSISNISPLNVIVKQQLEDVPNSINCNLFFALAKGEKIDFVIQKATELGAKNIVLIDLKRCVVKLDSNDFNKKLIRYNKIAKEASEQSRRLDIPNILGVYKLNNLPKELIEDSINLVAYEKEQGDTTTLFDDLNSIDLNKQVNIVVGPEGGFEPNEIEYLKSLGFKSVSLGNRILRTETAAVYALSVIGFMLER